MFSDDPNKIDLINKFKNENIDNLILNRLSNNDFRYVILDFTPLLWCTFINKPCIFSYHDTFEDFALLLKDTLKENFPDDTQNLENIAFSNKALVKSNSPNNALTGSIYNCMKDDNHIYVSWTKRSGNWKAAMLGITLGEYNVPI